MNKNSSQQVRNLKLSHTCTYFSTFFLRLTNLFRNSVIANKHLILKPCAKSTKKNVNLFVFAINGRHLLDARSQCLIIAFAFVINQFCLVMELIVSQPIFWEVPQLFCSTHVTFCTIESYYIGLRNWTSFNYFISLVCPSNSIIPVEL